MLRRLAEELGATEEALKQAFTAVRGNTRVTTENPEDQYQALEKYATDLTARARQVLDWEPRIGVTEGINRLCDWIDAQEGAVSPAPTGTAAEV